MAGVFDKLGCSIDDQTETCHWVNENSKTVIVKFTRAKTARKSGIRKGVKEPQNAGLSFSWARRNIYQQCLMPLL